MPAFVATLVFLLRDLRRTHGLSRSELSARTGGRISPSAIASYEDGHRALKMDTLAVLCAALGQSVRSLVGEAERRVSAFGKVGGAAGVDRGAVVVPLSVLARCTQPELLPLQRWARASARGARSGEVLLGWGGVTALAEIAGMEPARCAELLLSLSAQDRRTAAARPHGPVPPEPGASR
ncbi:helix-turn-helix transcriptional regulator [Amycolatopsis cynarae]|uniref:Helix-turn-helix transcriptional regulator n=1 Tax=Amycolatopsis cynarae TaxID=2995223 RepID=A0ABY7AYF2_9PSEU|nr:helix-turn-helix transcriptional regulator [Amycolatopsis sp. HUAS 11-8]WAL63967.1 helix-turn-helix transcriptional regulator [Amycolatopsis sp. HUAS 11-8]